VALLTGDRQYPRVSHAQLERNKQTLYRFYDDAFVRGDLDALDELLAPDIVGHDVFPPGVHERGVGGYKEIVGLFRTAFADLRYEFHAVIAEGSMVAAHVTMTATHAAEFLGIPPTGRGVRYHGMDFFRCDSRGRFVEHWAISDDLGWLRQLGALRDDERWSRPPE
jgi:steroid delta-isomerase-like uncharacterized protein